MSSVVDQSELGRKDLLKSSLFFICSKICLYITSNKCSDRVLSHTHTHHREFSTQARKMRNLEFRQLQCSSIKTVHHLMQRSEIMVHLNMFLKRELSMRDQQMSHVTINQTRF